MKKILSLIIITSMILCVSGCNKESDNNASISKIDSKVDYILLRDKKIYLSDNFNDFVLQFKGLGCTGKTQNSNIPGAIEIDSINSQEHEFYSLQSKNGLFSIYDINCSVSDSYFGTKFSVYVDYTSENKDTKLYNDKKIYYWSISPSEDITLRIDGETLKFGGDSEVTNDDVTKIMGNNYEKEESIITRGYYDLIYEIDKIEYKFAFNKDNELINMYVIK